jgi:hypothetical protein
LLLRVVLQNGPWRWKVLFSKPQEAGKFQDGIGNLPSKLADHQPLDDA